MKNRKAKPKGIQSTIMSSFSVVSIAVILILGGVLYAGFSGASRQEAVRSAWKLMEQTGESLEDYLMSMRQVSDTAYYYLIKENDFTSHGEDIQSRLNLLYEANRDKLQSLAVYNGYGGLIAAEPVAVQKENLKVTDQDWFLQAMDEVENMHFSTPHIQNLFDDSSFRYYWVISLSRAIEITNGGRSEPGVLLVDMDYSIVSRVMDQINASDDGEYYYLCDNSGKIIYHPRQIQINDGISRENSQAAASYKDGIYTETFEGEKRTVVVSTISYTGWKLVGVIPSASFSYGMINMRYFIVMLMLLMVMMLAAVNRTVAQRISRPILRLDESVKEHEAGEQPEIYMGGPSEVHHLGWTIQHSYEQIEELMKKIVLEQNERRKSELDALQSQINPHFLYNTLESITWMVEGEKNDEAVFMISQLAKLFRISLSKGKTIISVRDEIQHAQSYMNIQKIRYKNTFSVSFDVDPEICSCCTVKLVLQPILENAINYGVGSMDDSGEIRVVGREEDGVILLSVQDNGIGMSREEAELVLTDSNRIHKKGSGVGLVNVHRRIQIFFGEEYGLIIESEPDEGTKVTIRIPAVPFTEKDSGKLEKGRMFGAESYDFKDGTGNGHEEQ